MEVQASINSTTDELTATFETLKNSFNYFSEQAYSSLADWNQGVFNKSTADEVVTEYNYPSEFEASTQSGFNQGMFNGTSADRKNNSGDLGLGYRNGTGSGLEDGLVSYWRFDRGISGDGGKVIDYSGNGRASYTQNNIGTGSEGVFGTNAFTYENTNKQHLVLGHGNVSDVDFSSYSVNVWFRSEGGASDLATITGKTLEFKNKRTWILWFDDGSQYFTDGSLTWRAVGADDSTREVDIMDNSQDYRDGEWHMVTMVYKANDEGRLYVDGQFYDNQSVGQPATNASNIDIAVGGDPEDTDVRYFQGDIDEHRIYNRPLSGSEVKELYFNGRPFQGNYTAKKIDNSQETNWDSLEVNASIPNDTSVNATFKALDTNGDLVSSQQIDLNDSLHNYSLSVSSSEDAEVFINGTSSNVTKTWEIHGLEVFSSEIEYKVEDKLEGLRIGYRNGSTGDNLVGYWRMDRNVSGDGGTVVDYSGNENPGTTRGGVITGEKGTFSSNAMRFDGSNDRLDNIGQLMADPNTFTITGWFKPSGLSSTNAVFTSGDVDTNTDVWLRTESDNKLYGYFRDTSDNFPSVSGGSLSTGDWYFGAHTYNGSKQILYLNGEKIDSNTPGNDLVQDSFDTAEIGKQGAGGEEFSGGIDNVRIYNRSLPEPEIKHLYFKGRPFQGNYTAGKIDNGEETSWKKVEVNSSVPSDTNLTAEFEALDSSDNVVDREYISVDSGSNTKNYSLSVQASENARLSFNGTSSNVTKTWKVYDYEIYSGERRVDESESFDVQDGLNNYSLGVDDSKDARIKLNGTSSDVRESWVVQSLKVFAK